MIKGADQELRGMAATASFPQNEDVLVSFASDKINNGTGEYSPVQYDDQRVYFTSFQSRKESVLDGSEEDWTAKIYTTVREGAEYSKPEALSRVINRDDFHVGNVCFSADKKTMYFSRQVILNDQVSSSKLYRSRISGDEWGAAEPLTIVNGDWIATQPATGELFGDRVLFFVSDMDGGQGGLDLYYATIEGPSFGQPVNLGEHINTAKDDITPHYFDGKLYFSTEGRPGMGGYDLFVSNWDGNKLSNPSNLGRNYNGLFDDFYLSFNESGSRGYLVSNRPDPKKKKLKSETCCFDIYNFEIKELSIDLLVGVGTEDQKPLDGATVELSDLTVYDEPKTQTLPKEYRFKFDLNPERKYKVITSKKGYLTDTLEFTTNSIVEDETIRKKVILKKLKDGDGSGDPGYTIETVTINEPIRLDNIYYNFSRWNILPESEGDLTIIKNLMDEYQDMVIELSSHTDSRGTTPFNQNLSQKRAESAKNWITDLGIDEKRIVAKGYGEAAILNKCVNGARCTDEEHRFNRRTEFKIIAGPQTIQIRRETKKTPTSGKQSFHQQDPKPIITFEKGVQKLGKMKAGTHKTITYKFENTGDADLLIEFATACRCTDISWPKEPVAPGESGEIVAIFDSSDMEGPYQKTIDIIANTEPIVVEAKFEVEIVR